MTTTVRWEQTVRDLVEKHEAGQLTEIATGPRYLTLGEQVALLDFAAHTLAAEQNQDRDPASSPFCECGHSAEHHFIEQKHRRCQATVYTDAPLGGGNAYTCHCRDFSPASEPVECPECGALYGTHAHDCVRHPSNQESNPKEDA